MKRLTVTWTEFGETDDETEHSLPGKYEVCHRCRGHGSHVNPNIDSHGITEDEWNGPDWSNKDKETYLSGGYDVTCEVCKGEKVVVVVDEDACDATLYKRYVAAERQRRQELAEEAKYRRMENGGW